MWKKGAEQARVSSDYPIGSSVARAFYSGPEGRFTVVASDWSRLEKLLETDVYSLAMSFIRGEFAIRGDLYAAIRHFRARRPPPLRNWWFTFLAKAQAFATAHFIVKGDAARNIRFHYDRSNEFYCQFLDSRMQYSAGYFARPDTSLEGAQLEKLDQICKTLELAPEERFLDIGCGWGGLIIHAAERFNVRATGCTLSSDQFRYAQQKVAEKKLQDRVVVLETDYRDLDRRFDKIASVGMFEHVGAAHLDEYFAKVHTLLEPGGKFLNRGIVRPENVSDNPGDLFPEEQCISRRRSGACCGCHSRC